MSVRVSLAALLLAGSTCVSAGEATSSAPIVEHREEVDDPPAHSPRELQARSGAAAVVSGGHRSVQVNVDTSGMNIVGDAANEPSIAIDPSNPSRIVVGWRQFDTIVSNFRQAGYAYSHNGGQSWTFPGVLQPGQFRSDPVLAADSNGTFYFYSLSSVSSAEMFSSVDGGVNWSGPVPGHGGDKEWLGIDTTGGVGNDHIYGIWNSQFTCCAPGTDFTRSIDSGLLFQGPDALPQKAKWGTVAVGPDGEVYVVGTRITNLSFPDPHLILRSSSADEPTESPVFELTRGLSLLGETGIGGAPNPGGLLGQVWVAADHSNGPTRGNVYVLASVARIGFDPLDVMFLRSNDRGSTWSVPVKVNDDPPEGAYQWFGTMSVAPDGRVDVVWNDTRVHPSGALSVLYYAYSTDAGNSWSAGLPVTPAWNSLVGHPAQDKIGDYYQMISQANGAALAYAATFNGEQDVYFLRVGDCNQNGAHDAADIAGAASGDCNRNGIPDECEAIAPCSSCNGDGACDAGESCFNCPGDCIGGGVCGNGVCEPASAENCLVCPADCAGDQIGNPGDDFCCGDGAGDNPVDCASAQCSTDGFLCTSAESCCGDALCGGIEDATNCALDCNGLDSDLDGVRDFLDCAPANPTAFAVPGAIGDFVFANKQRLTWRSDAPVSGNGTAYDLVRGSLDDLPPGGSTEFCIGSGILATFVDDADEPVGGGGFYYLVRGANACGDGTFGVDSSGSPRVSLNCP